MLIRRSADARPPAGRWPADGPPGLRGCSSLARAPPQAAWAPATARPPILIPPRSSRSADAHPPARCLSTVRRRLMALARLFSWLRHSRHSCHSCHCCHPCSPAASSSAAPPMLIRRPAASSSAAPLMLIRRPADARPRARWCMFAGSCARPFSGPSRRHSCHSCHFSRLLLARCCSSDACVFWAPSWPSFLSFLSFLSGPRAGPAWNDRNDKNDRNDGLAGHRKFMKHATGSE